MGNFLLGMFGLIFLGGVMLGGWMIAGKLSSDALGMALGILFGVLAGLPMALMLLASQRSRRREDDPPRRAQLPYQDPRGYPGQYQEPRSITFVVHDDPYSPRENVRVVGGEDHRGYLGDGR